MNELARVCSPKIDDDAAKAQLDEAFRALNGRETSTVARMDLLTAIDDAVRLRDSLNACKRGGYPEELEPLPRGDYERELLREAIAIERGNDVAHTRAEEMGSYNGCVLIDWPEHLTRAMNEPEHMAYETFETLWPEHATPQLVDGIRRVIGAWRNRGRPRAGGERSEVKWSTAVELIAQAGLGDVTGPTLKSAWSRHAKEFGQTPQQDEDDFEK